MMKLSRAIEYRIKTLCQRYPERIDDLNERYGLKLLYRAEEGILFADWRDHPQRFKRLSRAMQRFIEGGNLERGDVSMVRGVLYTWAKWHGADEALVRRLQVANRMPAEKLREAARLIPKFRKVIE